KFCKTIHLRLTNFTSPKSSFDSDETPIPLFTTRKQHNTQKRIKRFSIIQIHQTIGLKHRTIPGTLFTLIPASSHTQKSSTNQARLINSWLLTTMIHQLFKLYKYNTK